MDGRERRFGVSGRLTGALVAFAVVRVGIALAVVAAEGGKLPALPEFRWRGLEGDAYGYHAAARELVSTAARPDVAAAVVAAVMLGGGGAALLRRRGRAGWLQLLAACAGVAGAGTAVVAAMTPPGAPVVGWPLLWAVPLAPVRAFGQPSLDVAWSIGVALSLAAVALATIACGLLGRWATGSDAIGVGSAALFALWPVATEVYPGSRKGDGGTQLTDLGLELVTEPLSTALVAAALALMVRPGRGASAHVGAGVLLGFSTAVKLTNGLVAAAIAPLVLWRDGARAAARYAAGCLLFAPLVGVYWDKGYVAIYGGSISAIERPWSLSYAVDNWTDSTLFTPPLLAALAPLLVVGVVVLRDRSTVAVLVVPVVVTVAVYSVYAYTALHPRFLFVALPSVFVLEATGMVVLGRGLLRRRARARRVPPT